MTSTTLKFPLAGAHADPARGEDAITRVRAALGVWRERTRQRRHLLALGADQLMDIGVSAEAAAREGHKPFWRA